uniref:IF rod domain-containing protein n=1 Tax=Poecilia mexicana TaxID=48701 RepID=A0A3B3Z5Q7_9TELE
MAMLRVSSYRRLFDDDGRSPNGGPRLRQASAGCDKIDFVAAKALNKVGLDRFVQERTTMAALNNRLVKLIELAHCLEEENGSLECQISDLEENLNGRPGSTEITCIAAKPKFSLEAAVEKLRRQRDEIICDTEELKEELECLQKEFEKAAHQRIVVQQGQQDAAEAVDAVTAECLALRDQVAIYEEQLANMETQHKTKELDDLEKSNEELLDEVEVKGAVYKDEVEELEFTITEMKQQEVDFKSQMKEQCEEYRELLSQKMARDMEIAAY